MLILALATIIALIGLALGLMLHRSRQKILYLESSLVQLQEKSLEAEENELIRDILSASYEKERIDKTAEKIINIVQRKYNMQQVSILLHSKRGFSIVATHMEAKHIKEMEKYCNELLARIEQEKGVAHIRCSHNYLSYPTAEERKIKYCYFIPLSANQEIIGGLLLEDRENKSSSGMDADFFQIVVDSISISLQNLIYYDQLVAFSMLDGLTQVYNRAYMEKFLQEEIEKNQHNGHTFTLAVLDIDHFKRFNDTYGHLFGDKVLKVVSAFIKSLIRENEDQIFRYGGEEFVIYFSKTTNQEVFQRLNLIREALSRLDLTDGEVTTHVTASFGLAEYPAHGGTIKELIEKADMALYKSKENGRNCITDYQDINKK